LTVKITKDGMPDLMKAVKALTKTEVLVGIPDQNAERKPEEGEKTAPSNNAIIGYTMEFGDTEKNIPARPFLVPGVQDARDDIASALKKAGQKALSGDTDTSEKALIGAGTKAASSVRAKIVSGPFAPLSQKTIEARAHRKNSPNQRAKKYLKLAKQGVPLDVLNDPGVGLANPLLDTGQLRNSVTFVLRDKGK